MQPYQNHYYNVVQKDIILLDSCITTSSLWAPKKISFSVSSGKSDESSVISSLSALNIIVGQTPLITQRSIWRQDNRGKSKNFKEVLGGKITLRGPKLYSFMQKLLVNVFPRIRQFEGLKLPAHKNIYCFTVKDFFVFEELIPLFPYFEDLNLLQCEFHFSTYDKLDILLLGRSLQLCFITLNRKADVTQ